jgi:guanylate kinase
VGRATDSPEKIEQRIAKAGEELGYAERFDRVVVNDNLDEAVEEVRRIVTAFIAE